MWGFFTKLFKIITTMLSHGYGLKMFTDC